MTYEDMRNEFYFLKDENITNLDTKDLSGEKWFPIYHNGDWFITELSNYGRFRIKNRIIKRMIDSVPFGLISILYRDIMNDRGNNKSLFIHAIDVMRSCREYYGDEMFDITTSNDTTIEEQSYLKSNESTYSESTTEPTYSESITEQQSIKEDVKDIDSPENGNGIDSPENGNGILVFNNDGDLVGEYSSRVECAKELNVSYTLVINSINHNTHLYYKYRIFRRSEIDGKTKIEPKYFREIRLYDPAGHFLEEFENSKEVENKFGVDKDVVKNFCHNKYFSVVCNGYLRQKKEVGDVEVIETPKNSHKYSRIIVLDKDHNKVQEFKTREDASKSMNLSYGGVINATKGKNDHYYKGYYFYKESEYLKKFIYKEED